MIVFVCYGWDDYEGGRNYIVFSSEEKAKDWVEKSQQLSAKYWQAEYGESKQLECQLEDMHSAPCDNFKYEKMTVN